MLIIIYLYGYISFVTVCSVKWFMLASVVGSVYSSIQV